MFLDYPWIIHLDIHGHVLEATLEVPTGSDHPVDSLRTWLELDIRWSSTSRKTPCNKNHLLVERHGHPGSGNHFHE